MLLATGGACVAHAPEAARSRSDEARVERLERRVAELEGTVARLQAELGTKRAGATPAPTSVPPTVATLAGRLERRLRDEPVDPAWSPRFESEITRAFQDSAELREGTRLLEATCRATLCRVVVAHDSPAAREAFLDRLPFTPPFQAQGLTEPREEAGALRTFIYLPRPGTRLEPTTPAK
jgi:hypothetical protein